MQRIKHLFFLAMIVLLAVATVGCNQKKDGPDGTAEPSQSGQNPDAAEKAVLIENGALKFDLFYTAEAKSSSRKAISLLKNACEKEFGISPETASVWDETNTENRVSVVFGMKEPPKEGDSPEFIREKDYLIQIGTDHVYIYAISEESYGTAANALLSRMKKNRSGEGASQSLILTAEDGVLYKGRYQIMKAEIEGVELNQFVILDSAKDESTENLAKTVCEQLNVGYGTKLPISKEEKPGGRYIKVETDGSVPAMHYGYTVENGNLILKAGGDFSALNVCQKVVTLLVDGSGSKEPELRNGDSFRASLLENPEGLAKPEKTDVRVMSSNIMASFEGWDSEAGQLGYTVSLRGEIFDAYLEIYQPDAIGIQECCDQWLDFLMEKCKNDSRWALATGGGSRIYFLNPILYRADRFRLVAEGRENFPEPTDCNAWGGRYYCWAVLESIGTGRRFVLLNTHWTGPWKMDGKCNEMQSKVTREKILELQKTYGCPVFTTGDFNTRDFVDDPGKDYTVPVKSEKDYAYMLETGQIKDAKFYSDHPVNFIGSIHAWGPGAFARYYSFDHIFVTSDTHVLQFKTCWDNQQHFISDHAFLIADVDLSTSKTST